MATPKLCTWPDGCKFPRLKDGRFCGKHSAIVLANLKASRDYRPDDDAGARTRARVRPMRNRV